MSGALGFLLQASFPVLYLELAFLQLLLHRHTPSVQRGEVLTPFRRAQPLLPATQREGGWRKRPGSQALSLCQVSQLSLAPPLLLCRLVASCQHTGPHCSVICFGRRQFHTFSCPCCLWHEKLTIPISPSSGTNLVLTTGSQPTFHM